MEISTYYILQILHLLVIMLLSSLFNLYVKILIKILLKRENSIERTFDEMI
jgi:hypothetical protein